MCGIVGYAGYNEAAPFLLEGLQKLEYRGYDSAGIAVFSDKVRTMKSQGRLPHRPSHAALPDGPATSWCAPCQKRLQFRQDRKSTRLNSSHRL